MSAKDATFFFVMSVACVVSIAFGVTYGRAGYWQVGLVPILLSPVAMTVLRYSTEFGRPAGILNPATQSWAFLFGDFIGLSLALGASALAWRRIDVNWPFTEGWFAFSVVAGMVVAAVFRLLINAPGYTGEDASRLFSPTSLWHDVVVYFVCATLLVYLGVPALIHDFGGFGRIALVGFVFWLAMGACDATIHKLDPANLHPRKEDTRLAP